MHRVVGRLLRPTPEGEFSASDPVSLSIAAGKIARVEPLLAAEKRGGAQPGADGVVGAPDLILCPALRDAHVHLVACAADRGKIDLRRSGAKSVSEVLAQITAAVGEGPDWLRMSGFEEATLEEHRMPSLAELDRAVGPRLVRIRHATRHGSLLSSAALARLESWLGPLACERRVPAFDGSPGAFVTGMEKELGALVGRQPKAELEDRLAELSAEMLSSGIVACDEMSGSNDAQRVALLAQLASGGRLQQRIRVYLGDADELDAALLQAGSSIEIRGVKLFAHSAEQVWQREFVAAVTRARHRGLPLAIHAVELGEISAVCDILESASPRVGAGRIPDRIEHCALCPPELVQRLAKLGCAVVVQPGFLVERADKYREEVEPPLWSWLHPYRAFLEAGLEVAGGSDAPVASWDPEMAFRGAVRRRGHLVLPGSTGTGTAPAERQYLTSVEALGLYAARPRRLDGVVRGDCWFGEGDPADLLLLEAMPSLLDWSRTKILTTLVGGVEHRL